MELKQLCKVEMVQQPSKTHEVKRDISLYNSRTWSFLQIQGTNGTWSTKKKSTPFIYNFIMQSVIGVLTEI